MIVSEAHFLARGIHDKLASMARARLPNEICGLLIGEDDVISKIVEIANVSASPRHSYRMHEGELLKALRDIDSSKRSLVAIFHSHPFGEATLSEHDMRSLSANGLPLWNCHQVVIAVDEQECSIVTYSLTNGTN